MTEPSPAFSASVSPATGCAEDLVLHGCQTLVEVLQHWSVQRPGQPAFTFLREGIEEAGQFSFAELDRAARAIAVELQAHSAPGDRALLLYPPGIEFLAGFFGCLYAGIIGIPAPPPDPARLKRTLPRLRTIIDDAQASLVVATAAILEKMGEDSLPDLRRVASDSVPLSGAESWQPPPLTAETVAYLQYTSGSTSAPKGVVLTHANVVNHLRTIAIGMRAGVADRVTVTWMPYFHDLGLIDGLLAPLYCGDPCYVLSPLTVIKRPQRWLTAIQRYHATHSASPNFGYELCLQRVTAAQRAELDLSSLRYVINGAEPIRPDTQLRFVETFAACGLPPNAVAPGYGMAEATLVLTATRVGQYPVLQDFAADILHREGRAVPLPAPADAPHAPETRTLVGCGPVFPEVELLIVDPQQHRRCSEGQVGEVWVASPGVAAGYWNRPEATARIFGARLADAPERGPYLRTGDLGFLWQDQYFFTGRLKDVIIVAGVNHYPQDIEWTVEAAAPDIRPDHCAAFSVEADGEERLVIVAETVRPLEDYQPLMATLRAAVAETHELDLAACVILKKGGILKTSSGKLQRHGCKQAFLDGSLASLTSWVKPVLAGCLQPASSPQAATQEAATLASPAVPPSASGPSASGPSASGPSASGPSARQTALASTRVREWLIVQLAHFLQIPRTAIDPTAPFAAHGLTSRIGVELVGELETWLNCAALSPTLLWEYATVDALSEHLAPLAAQAFAPSAVDAADAERLDPAGQAVSSPAARSTGVASAQQEPAAPRTAGIAIVAMSCRFPGAADPEAFWELLRTGRESVRARPAGRWEEAGWTLQEGVGPGRIAALRAGFLESVDTFDPTVFGITAREAEVMDPQQRLLLELTWEVLERAGRRPEDMAGSATGVFIGISTEDYSHWQLADPLQVSAYTGPGKAFSIAANRLSYQFDLTGPSLAIDTACSSSLVALHQAVHSLQRGECAWALAGGVNLLLAPHMSVALSQGGMLGPSGHCRTFDAAADGYVRGEGGAILLLKRLDAAQRDGDPILAVIRGSAVNQDGRSNGLTAPNGQAQQRVIRAALAAADLTPDAIGYVEAHGTGTPLGDPIEVKALQSVLGQGRTLEQPCALGSVKANIGHLEAAAGVAGLVKTVLSLQHGEIPPHPHFQTLNPLITLDGTPFFIPTQRTPWPAGPRRAGISSFGFGGTNAHVILEAAPPAVAPSAAQPVSPPPPLSVPARRWQPLWCSARDPAALRALAERWQQCLIRTETDPAVTVADWGVAAATLRAQLPERLAVYGDSPAALVAALEAYRQGQPGDWVAGRARPGQVPRVGFLFTGQGAQYPEMGRALFESEPVFRAVMEECDRLLQLELGFSLLSVLYPAPEDAPADATDAEAAAARLDAARERLQQTSLTQPALFALEYALARLWQHWGIQPAALLGHSIGEYVAACLAGVFSLEDALRLVVVRGRLMQNAPGQGGMYAVRVAEDTLQPFLAGQTTVSIAAYNGPADTVLSGALPALEALVTRLTAAGIEGRFLPVSHAFHSLAMEPILPAFARALSRVTLSPPQYPIYSNLTGRQVGAEMATVAYWVEHLRQPVRFLEGFQAMQQEGLEAYLEIGPKPTLLALAQGILAATEPLTQAEASVSAPGTGLGAASAHDDGSAAPLWLASLRPKVDAQQQMLQSLLALQVHGAPVATAALWPECPPRRDLRLPAYPWQRQRYWLPAVAAPNPRILPLPGRALRSPALRQVLFENRYEARALTFLDEHRVFGRVVVAAAANLAFLLEAARAQWGEVPCTVQEVLFARPLVLPEPGGREVQLVLETENAAGGGFTLLSMPEVNHPDWVEHVSGQLLRSDGVAADAGATRTLEQCRSACPEAFAGDFYADVWQSAIQLGAGYRWVDALWRGPDAVLARLRPHPAALGTETTASDYRLAPGLIDSMLQILAMLVPLPADEAIVPFRFAAFHWHAAPASQELFSHLVLRTDASTDTEFVSDVWLFDAHGTLVAEAQGFRARRIGLSSLLRELGGGLEEVLYHTDWVETPWEEAPTPTAATPALVGGGTRLLVTAVPACDPLAATLAEQLVALWTDAGVRCACVEIVAGSEPTGAEAGVAAGALAGEPVPVRAGWHRWALTDAPQAWADWLTELGPLDEVYYLPPLLSLPETGTATVPARTAQDDLLEATGSALFAGHDVSSAHDAPSAPVAALLNATTVPIRLLLALLRALQSVAPAPRLTLLTRNAQAVQPGEVPHAAQAALWGLARVMRLEHPEWHCRCVDWTPAASHTRAGLQRLAQWLQTADSFAEGALRAERAWSAHLVRAVPGPQPASGTLRMDRAGTYLVSGGLGALGLQLAAWLVGQGARHLLLLGRRPPQPGAQEEALSALRAQGAEVRTLALDVADVAAVLREIPVAVQDWPPVRGVFHLAGHLEDAMLLQQDAHRLRAVLAPKLAGLAALHQLTLHWPLEHFVGFSSVASLTGSLGQGGYAAANAAMEAFLQARRAHGLPGLAIQWGPWAQAGMAANLQEADRQRLREFGLDWIDPAIGMDWCGRLLEAQNATVAVLPIRWETHFARLYAGDVPPLFRQLQGSVAGTTAAPSSAEDWARPLAALPAAEARALLETRVRALLGGALGLGDGRSIAPRQRFFEMGLDSLGAVELKNRLAASLSRRLRATLLFDFPTLSALLDHLGQELGLPVDGLPVPEAIDPDPGLAADLATLAEDDLAALLAAELQDP